MTTIKLERMQEMKTEVEGAYNKYGQSILGEYSMLFVEYSKELIAALETSQRELAENEIRFRIAEDDIAKLRETISDYQSLLKEE